MIAHYVKRVARHISQEVEETKSMSRWRDTKKGTENKNQKVENQVPELEVSAPLPSRIKAFIVDMFMIMMPLAYLTTYVFMDGKDEFQGSDEARWAISLIYGTVIVLFWITKGQTPGQKAYDVKLIDQKTRENISLLKAIIRYFLFLVSAMTIFLSFIPFFRKDKKTMQDIFTGTIVIPFKK